MEGPLSPIIETSAYISESEYDSDDSTSAGSDLSDLTAPLADKNDQQSTGIPAKASDVAARGKKALAAAKNVTNAKVIEVKVPEKKVNTRAAAKKGTTSAVKDESPSSDTTIITEESSGSELDSKEMIGGPGCCGMSSPEFGLTSIYSSDEECDNAEDNEITTATLGQPHNADEEEKLPAAQKGTFGKKAAPKGEENAPEKMKVTVKKNAAAKKKGASTAATGTEQASTSAQTVSSLAVNKKASSNSDKVVEPLDITFDKSDDRNVSDDEESSHLIQSAPANMTEFEFPDPGLDSFVSHDDELTHTEDKQPEQAPSAAKEDKKSPAKKKVPAKRVPAARASKATGAKKGPAANKENVEANAPVSTIAVAKNNPPRKQTATIEKEKPIPAPRLTRKTAADNTSATTTRMPFCTSVGQTTAVCYRCNEAFKGNNAQKDMDKHLKDCGLILCVLCNKKYKSIKNLQVHQLKMHKSAGTIEGVA